jgi:hypothetical protein
MEGFYEPTTRFKKETGYSDVAKQIFWGKRDIGICCFSDVPDNELMWSHYTGNYAGICVGYRPSLVLQGLPAKTHLVRLTYGLAPPIVGNAGVLDPDATARQILSHKKASWAYEREWRVLGPLGRIDILAKGCVRELYLGQRMPLADQCHIVKAVADLPIRIYVMEVERYMHKWVRLKSVKPHGFTAAAKAKGYAIGLGMV